MRILSPRWLLGFAFGALLLTCVGTLGQYVAHLRHQRQLQDQFADFSGSEHWLSEYLPEDWRERLPATELQLYLYEGNASLDAAKQLAGVARLHVSMFDAPDVWKAVQPHRSVEWLEIQSEVTDAQITDLADFRELSTLYIVDAPITDASLVTLAKLRKLESLRLHGTGVTHSAITAFSAANPNVEIEWTPAMTSSQAELVRDLQKLIGVEPERTPSIEPVLAWDVVVGSNTTRESVARLAALQGPIHRLTFAREVDWEVAESLRDMPELRIVWWNCPVTAAEVRLFLGLTSVRELYVDSDLIPPEDFVELKSRGMTRIHDQAALRAEIRNRAYGCY